eukprot:SAG11_NODE_59_length_19156_cov_11.188750_8_plen_598_part_00
MVGLRLDLTVTALLCLAVAPLLAGGVETDVQQVVSMAALSTPEGLNNPSSVPGEETQEVVPALVSATKVHTTGTAPQKGEMNEDSQSVIDVSAVGKLHDKILFKEEPQRSVGPLQATRPKPKLGFDEDTQVAVSVPLPKHAAKGQPFDANALVSVSDQDKRTTQAPSAMLPFPLNEAFIETTELEPRAISAALPADPASLPSDSASDQQLPPRQGDISDSIVVPSTDPPSMSDIPMSAEESASAEQAEAVLESATPPKVIPTAVNEAPQAEPAAEEPADISDADRDAAEQSAYMDMEFENMCHRAEGAIDSFTSAEGTQHSCCSATCGGCGGKYCFLKPGGKEACCTEDEATGEKSAGECSLSTPRLPCFLPVEFRTAVGRFPNGSGDISVADMASQGRDSEWLQGRFNGTGYAGRIAGNAPAGPRAQRGAQPVAASGGRARAAGENSTEAHEFVGLPTASRWAWGLIATIAVCFIFSGCCSAIYPKQMHKLPPDPDDVELAATGGDGGGGSGYGATDTGKVPTEAVVAAQRTERAMQSHQQQRRDAGALQQMDGIDAGLSLESAGGTPTYDAGFERSHLSAADIDSVQMDSIRQES